MGHLRHAAIRPHLTVGDIRRATSGDSDAMKLVALYAGEAMRDRIKEEQEKEATAMEAEAMASRTVKYVNQTPMTWINFVGAMWNFYGVDGHHIKLGDYVLRIVAEDCGGMRGECPHFRGVDVRTDLVDGGNGSFLEERPSSKVLRFNANPIATVHVREIKQRDIDSGESYSGYILVDTVTGNVLLEFGGESSLAVGNKLVFVNRLPTSLKELDGHPFFENVGSRSNVSSTTGGGARFYRLSVAGKIPVACLAGEYALWFASPDGSIERRQVAIEHIQVDQAGTMVEVSTVFVGLASDLDNTKPLLFETLVFGGKLDGRSWGAATWEEAEAVHDAAVEEVYAAELDPDIIPPSTPKPDMVEIQSVSASGGEWVITNAERDAMQKGLQASIGAAMEKVADALRSTFEKMTPAIQIGLEAIAAIAEEAGVEPTKTGDPRPLAKLAEREEQMRQEALAEQEEILNSWLLTTPILPSKPSAPIPTGKMPARFVGPATKGFTAEPESNKTYAEFAKSPAFLTRCPVCHEYGRLILVRAVVETRGHGTIPDVVAVYKCPDCQYGIKATTRGFNRHQTTDPLEVWRENPFDWD